MKNVILILMVCASVWTSAGANTRPATAEEIQAGTLDWPYVSPKGLSNYMANGGGAADPSTTVLNGMIAHWSLLRTNADTDGMQDSTGNGNNLTMNVAGDIALNTGPKWRDGNMVQNIGNSMDGAAYPSISGISIADNWIISGWIYVPKQEMLANPSALFDIYTPHKNLQFDIYTASGAGSTVSIAQDGGAYLANIDLPYYWSSSDGFALGWMFFALKRKAPAFSAEMFSQEPGGYAPNENTTFTTSITLGATVNGLYPIGQGSPIAHVRVWNRVLTEQEILAAKQLDQ